MTRSKNNEQRRKPANLAPYAMLGAGCLASTLWKTGNELVGWRYHFNIFRMTDRGQVGQRFAPSDLIDLLKLTRVLAATLADDGCMSPYQRRELAQLASMLDQIIPPKD